MLLKGAIGFDKIFLISKFSMSQFLKKGFFPIFFFYLGMLTMESRFTLKLPNLNMQRIFVEYFNELHHIDVSTRYTDMMRAFVSDLDLKALFAGYWKAYVSQLPAPIFSQVQRELLPPTTFMSCAAATLTLVHLERGAGLSKGADRP